MVALRRPLIETKEVEFVESQVEATAQHRIVVVANRDFIFSHITLVVDCREVKAVRAGLAEGRNWEVHGVQELETRRVVLLLVQVIMFYQTV